MQKNMRRHVLLALAAQTAACAVLDYDFRARGDPSAIADLFGASQLNTPLYVSSVITQTS